MLKAVDFISLVRIFAKTIAFFVTKFICLFMLTCCFPSIILRTFYIALPISFSSNPYYSDGSLFLPLGYYLFKEFIHNLISLFQHFFFS